MTKQTKTFTDPTDNEIAAYAYKLWEAEGRPDGHDLDHWLQAKAHLTADRQYEAGVLGSPTASREGDAKKKRKAEMQNGRSTPRQPAYA
ncbi:MAG: DUF2934 domain-containing protein [Limisphaerales bacterium]